MQNTINDIKYGLTIWIFFLITVFIWWFIVYAAWWNTTSPTTITNDTAVFTDSWNTLTAAKWNELVTKVNYNNSKWLNSAKVLNCSYYQVNAWTAGSWKTQTWTASDCWWVNKPSDFTYVLPSIKKVDWGWLQRWVARCYKDIWWIYLDTANSEVSLECSYLVWN